MAWRDWLRRRPVAAPETAPAPGVAASGSAADAAPHSGVPGDWDGGWRMTSPLPLTVSRAPLGVSDGLAFRGGLAAWQDPSFDTGLAHAVLPTAPSGLLRGVARPAAPGPRATAPGGPLLLRAIRPQGVAEENGPGATEPTVSERVLGRGSGTGTGTGTGRGTGTGSGSGTSGAPVATPGAGRSGRGGGAAPVGPVGPVVARAASREGENPGNARDSSASPNQAERKASSESAVQPAGEGDSRATGRAPGSTPAPHEGRVSGPAVQRSGASGPAPDLTMPVGQDPAVESPPAGGGSSSHGPAVRRVRTAEATGPGEPSRGLVSPRPPAVLGAVQRAAFPSADAARPGPVHAPLPAFPLVRRIAVVPGRPGTPADGPAQAGAWAVPAPTPRVQRATAPSATPEARAVVRPRGVGRTLTVARVAAVPRRRVAVVPHTATASAPPPVQRARSTEEQAPLGAPAAPETASASRPPTEPGPPGTAPAPTVPAMPVLQRKAEAPTDGPAEPATVSTGTTPGSAPKRPVLRREADENADNPTMPERPVLQRTTDEPIEAPAASLTEPSVASAPAMPTLQRSTAEPTDTPATPLTRPPATTTPAVPAFPRKAEAPTGGPAAADRPVLQRTADGPPVGLGAPMAQLPPTGRTTRPAPARPAAPLAPLPTPRRRTDGPPDSPVTAGGPTATTPAAPGPRPARARTGLGAPLAALPASAAPRMPSVDVQRAAAPATARPSTVSSGTAWSTGNASRPASARGADVRGGEGRPMPLVVARRVDDPDGIARHQVPGSSRTAAHSLQLLADRTLTTGLSADAPGLPTAPTPTRTVPVRPVVPARWASASADSPTGSPTAPSTASGSPAVQRVAVAPAAAPGFHPPRPAPDARRTAAPLPVTGPQAQGVAPFVVQPAPAGPGPAVPALPGVARPAPTVTSVPAAPAGRTAPAAPVVQPRSAATPSPVAPVQRAAKPPASASAKPAPKSGSTPQAVADTDLDDLARKLIDPVARLLRADLRRGRERTGRPFDGRR